MHGQFVWYELTTPDVDAAVKFYPRFTNWGTQAFDKNYTMFTTGGVPIAGIFRQTPEMKSQGVPPNWMPYIEADNIDATAAKAKSLGATIVAGPDDIPGTGRFAVIQDPQGAVFGIYKSTNNPSGGWDGTPVVNRFSWHELMTTDYQVAEKFYSALFGWQKISETDMGDGLMYYIFGKQGKMYGGMFNTPANMAGMHPFWLVYIHVKDVGKAVNIATKAGATVQRPQMDIPGGSIAILGDPQGAGYAVHHVSAPAAAAQPATAVKAAVTAAVKAVVKAVKKVRPKKKAAAKKKAKAKAPARKARNAATKPKPKTKTKAKAKKAKAAPRKRAAKARPRRKAKAKK